MKTSQVLLGVPAVIGGLYMTFVMGSACIDFARLLTAGIATQAEVVEYIPEGVPDRIGRRTIMRTAHYHVLRFDGYVQKELLHEPYKSNDHVAIRYLKSDPSFIVEEESVRTEGVALLMLLGMGVGVTWIGLLLVTGRINSIYAKREQRRNQPPAIYRGAKLYLMIGVGIAISAFVLFFPLLFISSALNHPLGGGLVLLAPVIPSAALLFYLFTGGGRR